VSSFGAGLDHDFIVPESGVIICKDEAIEFQCGMNDLKEKAWMRLLTRSKSSDSELYQRSIRPADDLRAEVMD